MSAITTHVLDTARGRPAAGIHVRLDMQGPSGWRPVGQGVTDADGRLRTLMPADAPLAAGQYRLEFDTGSYFATAPTFFPRIVVEFLVADGESHYHVPVLLSPFGYTTYRGT